MDPAFTERVIQAAIRAGHLGDEQPLAAFIDIAGVKGVIGSLREAFPDHFEHAFAAKANPMRRALELVREAGMGCEVASPGELGQALRAGFKPERIVYDEPAKTMATLKRVLAANLALNIDNFQEFERVASLLREIPSRSCIGFRINPQVGAGKIGAMSTATQTSKFGVALEDNGNRQALIDCYRNNAWLTALHAHIGSQGCSLDLMAAGISKLVDLAGEINAAVDRRQVDVIDIGGGLPVNFDSEEVRPTFAHYAGKLRTAAPDLFSGRYRVLTEFGRSIFAKNGFMVARIEYTKSSGGRRIAISHAGAQVATRTVFMPGHWKIRLSVFDSSGRPRTGASIVQDVAGPLCFAGDLVGSGRELPLIEPGDYVVLHDTGAYYFSNHFYYNALPAPAVFGVEDSGSGTPVFHVWRQWQTPDELAAVLS